MLKRLKKELQLTSSAREAKLLVLLFVLVGCGSGSSQTEESSKDSLISAGVVNNNVSTELISTTGSERTSTTQVVVLPPQFDRASGTDGDINDSLIIATEPPGRTAESSADTSDGANTDTNAEAISDSDLIDGQVVESMINASNYNDLIVQAFEVFSGRAFDARLNESEYVASLDPISCLSGMVDDTRENEHIYNNCVLNDALLNGSLVRNLVFNSSNLIFSDFTASEGGGVLMKVDGQYNRKCCSSSVEFHTLGLDYEFNYIGGHLVVNNASTYKSASSNSSVMGGQFSMRPPFLNGSSIDVVVQSEFSASPDEPWKYDTGKLLLAAQDGSSLLLDAFNSTSSGIRVSVTNNTGTHNFTESWDVYRDAIEWSLPVEVQVLHYTDGRIMNLLAGDGLDLMAITTRNAITSAMASASSVNVNDLVEVLSVTESIERSRATSRETQYQCGTSGSMTMIEKEFSYAENDGFFNLMESRVGVAYRMLDCSFWNPNSPGHFLTLNGSFTEETDTRSGRKHSSSGNTLIFESLHIISDREVEGTVKYFADAQITTSHYINADETGSSRHVMIEEYEKISNRGVLESVLAADFSQRRHYRTFTGKSTIEMSVSGQYIGESSDHYRVDVATIDDFDVIWLDFENPNSTETAVAANGQFLLSSMNGDQLNIVVQPSGRANNYYLANLDSMLSEGKSVTLENLPFYRYQEEWVRFSL